MASVLNVATLLKTTTFYARIVRHSFATCAQGVASQWSLHGQFAPIAQRQLQVRLLLLQRLPQWQNLREGARLRVLLTMQETGALREKALRPKQHRVTLKLLQVQVSHLSANRLQLISIT